MSATTATAKGESGYAWMTLLRLCGAAGGAMSIAVGIWQLVTFTISPRGIINAIYQIIFGILILIAEARWSGLLKHFKFLTHFLGLGMFYVFVASLALGGAWYQYAEAILLLCVGIIYLLLGAACRTMASPSFNQPAKFGAAGYSDPTTAGQVRADGTRQPDAITDLKKKAAHMAVDHAIDNNANPFA